MPVKPIPVVDLFAGPGGLGEGFSSLPRFRIAVSIEKEPNAHQTLLTRSFFRQFTRGDAPDHYYRMLRGELSREELFRLHPAQAEKAAGEALLRELGKDDVRDELSNRLKRKGDCVLIGGPPCQAYSLVGRSRNRGIAEYRAEDDHRHFLYREYLRVIADHEPAVFVMENVKGILSAKVNDEGIFARIIEDLSSPAKALRRKPDGHHYSIFPLVPSDDLFASHAPGDYVVRCEDYGVPQARHRVILLGVRDDIRRKPEPLKRAYTVNACTVLDGLPALRSGLSDRDDSPDAWLDAIRSFGGKRWVASSVKCGGERVEKELERVIKNIRSPDEDRGAEFIPGKSTVDIERDWFLDRRLKGVCNHSTRSHMTSDLARYLYASCYGKVHGQSPTLSQFPKDLLPEHANVEQALSGGHFEDRFRVQVANRPSTTITSHISKDGHYYIHPDPGQCRSLTVREAARLQTFPDNYLFTGGRTAQYQQVGNAVPPLLASQIASIVSRLMD